MTDPSLISKLKARGEEVLGQLSGQLMSNPQFMKAMEGALKGKQKLDQAVGRVLKQMNIPTRTEFKRALARIETLERELATLKAAGERSAPKPRRKPAARAARAAKPVSPAGPAE